MESMFARRRAIVTLAAVFGLGMGSPCFSDPAETTPEVSAQDPDYVSGRKALEAKNWPSAIKSFSLAAERNPVTLTSRITSDTLTANQESSISHSRTIIKLSR